MFEIKAKPPQPSFFASIVGAVFKVDWTQIFLTFLPALIFFGDASAFEFGSHQPTKETNTHLLLNSGIPNGREGGENIETAIVILGLPFADNGNTSNNQFDYDAMCPFTSYAPDVVYSYLPLQFEVVSVDLCGSGYDTKTYILDDQLRLVACNDDFYTDDVCGPYVSKIEEALLEEGQTYYFVIDGYGGDSGDYSLLIEVISNILPEPCSIICSGFHEGEPSLDRDYVDSFNGGCNVPEFGNPLQNIGADQNGDLTLCGVAGWFDLSSGGYGRDTDWFTFIFGSTGIIEITADAEFETIIFELGPPDCQSFEVVQNLLVGDCSPGSLLISGTPGETAWLFVASSSFSPPQCNSQSQYNYIITFTGLESGTVVFEKTSFGSLKALFR